MTIYKHVLKNKNTPFLRHFLYRPLCIFYSVSTVHTKDQKKTKQMRMTRKYHNHTLQTKTRPDIIMHSIKQRNLFHFEHKLYAQNSVSVLVPFVPNVVVQHVSDFVACCVEATHYILLMGGVAYDARFSVCNKRNIL